MNVPQQVFAWPSREVRWQVSLRTLAGHCFESYEWCPTPMRVPTEKWSEDETGSEVQLTKASYLGLDPSGSSSPIILYKRSLRGGTWKTPVCTPKMWRDTHTYRRLEISNFIELIVHCPGWVTTEIWENVVPFFETSVIPVYEMVLKERTKQPRIYLISTLSETPRDPPC